MLKEVNKALMIFAGDSREWVYEMPTATKINMPGAVKGTCALAKIPIVRENSCAADR